MKGLALSRAYYEEYGAPMLKKEFPELSGLICCGLAGDGSECFGFDDEVSRDHDFEPGFCLFLPEETIVDRRTAFRLERAYAALPKEFSGIRRSPVSPVGGNRHGVIRIGDFFEERTGFRDGIPSARAWLSVPDLYLASAVNGEVFYDGLGHFTELRRQLKNPPEDIRRKKLAAALLLSGQAGQYNYPRCLAHGEPGAAQLAVAEFVRHTIRAVFLLNRRWCPFYKWMFRGMRDLPRLSEIGDSLEYLLTTDNRGDITEAKKGIIEDIAAILIETLRQDGLSHAVCTDLERHAVSVNNGIADPELRNLHLLFAE